jgi:hypothetical protein
MLRTGMQRVIKKPLTSIKIASMFRKNPHHGGFPIISRVFSMVYHPPGGKTGTGL